MLRLRGTLVARALREVAIVALAAAIVSVFLQKVRTGSWLGRISPPVNAAAFPNMPTARVGMPLPMKDVDFSRHALTAVLILSPNCKHCVQSQAFYRSLSVEARRRAVPIIVAFPKTADARGFLQSAGLTGAYTKIWDDLGLSILGTPTLLIIDSKGLIRRVWVGALSAQRQSDALALIADPLLLTRSLFEMASGETNFSDADLDRLRNSKRKVTIIDVRERAAFANGHAAAAVNIPLIELDVRAPFELDKSDRNVVDCSAITDSACQSAVNYLAHNSFQNIAVLNAGGVEMDRCKVTLAGAGR